MVLFLVLRGSVSLRVLTERFTIWT